MHTVSIKLQVASTSFFAESDGLSLFSPVSLADNVRGVACVEFDRQVRFTPL